VISDRLAITRSVAVRAVITANSVKAKRQSSATFQFVGRTDDLYGVAEPGVLEKYIRRRGRLQRPIRALTG
jgi:hypothetical protein